MKKLYPLFTLLLVLAFVLSACGQAATPAAEEPMEEAAAQEPMEDMANEVEVFSWWTGGGEAAGLEAMIKVFNAEYPDIKFINAAVAGGAGTNARAVLATDRRAGRKLSRRRRGLAATTGGTSGGLESLERRSRGHSAGRGFGWPR